MKEEALCPSLNADLQLLIHFYRESWSVLTPGRWWSVMEALCLLLRREATSRPVPGPLRLPQSTPKQVGISYSDNYNSLPLITVKLFFFVFCGCKQHHWYVNILMVSFSETAAQGVPESRRQRHADLHFLRQWWQTGEQRQQAHLHSKFNRTSHHVLLIHVFRK